jgi:hypothetical protein
MTYKETRPWAEAMKYMVLSKQMPPWFAERPYVPVVDHGNLSAAEVDTIVRWVELGTPAGDPKDAPPPIYFQESRYESQHARGSVRPIAWR